MSISDDFTIDLTNRMIYHDSGTTVYSVNELYSWLMAYFDDSSTIDDTIPMTAQTPTQYTLINGWYINHQYHSTFEFLNSGGLKTIGHDADTYDTGIRMLTFQSSGYTSAVVGDLGREVGYTATSTDTGTLLDFNNITRKWVVRVDDTGDDFSDTTNSIDLDDGTGTGGGTLSTTSTTGENEWANLYTIGTLESNTQIYLIQDATNITPWWSTGHINVIQEVKEAGTLIDEGFITVMARQYSKLYDHFIVAAASGGRIPVPIATFADTNNNTGFRTMSFNNGSGATLLAGEIITNDGDSDNNAIVTAVTGAAAATGTIDYYPFDYPLTDFTDTDSVTATTSTKTFDVNGAPTDNNPPVLSGITFTFAATQQDLNNGEGDQPYDVIIDANSNTLADLYEYLKYVTRYGSTTSLNGHDGEQYTAVGEQYITYENMSGTFVEGNTITGDSSGATGVIVSDHTSDTALVLRDIVGTFEDGEGLTEGANTADIIATEGIEDISPNKQSPFGSFAGGKFFGARGVWIDNVPSIDLSNYQLIDSTGTARIPPTNVDITVNNTESGDRISVFRTTGDNEIINKQLYTIQQTHTSPAAYIRVLPGTIEADAPSNGTIRVVRRDGSGNIQGEELYSYTAWTSGGTYDEFTLSSTTTRDYDTNDSAYVPYIDEQATGTSVTENIVYASDRYVLTRVRITGMLPFKVKGQITTNGLTVTTIRTSDAVYQ